MPVSYNKITIYSVIVINWLMELPSLYFYNKNELKLINNELLYLTVEYMDFYLKTAENSVKPNDLYLIAGVCLFMASKFLYNSANICLNELAIDIFKMTYSK
jgi:hypothetical protein